MNHLEEWIYYSKKTSNWKEAWFSKGKSTLTFSNSYKTWKTILRMIRTCRLIKWTKTKMARKMVHSIKEVTTNKDTQTTTTTIYWITWIIWTMAWGQVQIVQLLPMSLACNLAYGSLRKTRCSRPYSPSLKKWSIFQSEIRRCFQTLKGKIHFTIHTLKHRKNLLR